MQPPRHPPCPERSRISSSCLEAGDVCPDLQDLDGAAAALTPASAPRRLASLAPAQARLAAHLAAMPRDQRTRVLLAAQIRAIEGRPAQLTRPAPAAPGRAQAGAGVAARADAWTFGVAALDGCLPGHALDPGAVHEIKPWTYGDTPAALGLALRLAARYQRAADAAAGLPILWCAGWGASADWGRPYGQGLRHLGLDPERLLLVAPRTEADALWVIEEALRSGAAALVLGVVPVVDLTQSRRLALAAAAARTPAVLVTDARTPGAGAAATRWRTRRLPSSPHPLGLASPGAQRLALNLERCRAPTRALNATWMSVEWCHVAHRFRVAAAVADRTAGDRPAGQRSA